MNFLSYSFVLLFLVAMFMRLTWGREGRNGIYINFLIVLSFVFYSWHIPWHFFLLLYACVVSYTHGVWLHYKKKRYIVLCGVVLLLLPLLIFKYFDFSIDNIINPLAGAQFQGLGFLLPIGISFYTFQSISYLVDIYRGDISEKTSFRDVVLYIAFFPQLVAGPIVKAKEFLFQIDRKRSCGGEAFWYGLYLILQGYFLKFVCADNLAPLVERGWQALSHSGSISVDSLGTILGFSFQIFYDFAGYTLIAKGLAYLLGFVLPDNFNCPYIATSFSDFWRRWHISLSTWFRDYLYIPLGGNRLGTFRTSCNLFVVMLLCGIWHGAAWTYVFWGGLHGAFLIIERYIPKRYMASYPMKIGWYVVVQIGVLLGWVFFRATSLTEAFHILHVFARSSEPFITTMSHDTSTIFIFIIPGVFLHCYGFIRENLEKTFTFGNTTLLTRRCLLSGLYAYCILTCYGTSSNFLYFAF